MNSTFQRFERTLGGHYTKGYDATPWLEFFTTSLRVEAERLADELTEWNQAVVRLQEKFDAMRLNRRKAEGLIYAYRVGRISEARATSRLRARPREQPPATWPS